MAISSFRVLVLPAGCGQPLHNETRLVALQPASPAMLTARPTHFFSGTGCSRIRPLTRKETG